MLDDGLLERFPVRAVYGMHNWPGMPVGCFAVREGPCMAMADEFRIRIRGVGGHAAKPEDARDPIVAGAALVQALQTVVSRRIDPLEAAVLSVTQFNAGVASNVIPETTELAGTVRVFSEALHAQIGEEIVALCDRIGAAYGCAIAYEPGDSVYPPVLNDPAEAAFCAGVLQGLAGRDRVTQGHAPVMGSEDFAFLSRARPGCFVFCGTGDISPLHHPNYDFNDAAAPWGVAYWTRLAEAALPRG
jgi:hippurate hydrolase